MFVWDGFGPENSPGLAGRPCSPFRGKTVFGHGMRLNNRSKALYRTARWALSRGVGFSNIGRRIMANQFPQIHALAQRPRPNRDTYPRFRPPHAIEAASPLGSQMHRFIQKFV